MKGGRGRGIYEKDGEDEKRRMRGFSEEEEEDGDGVKRGAGEWALKR